LVYLFSGTLHIDPRRPKCAGVGRKSNLQPAVDAVCSRYIRVVCKETQVVCFIEDEEKNEKRGRLEENEKVAVPV